jgi:hypothetical protein
VKGNMKERIIETLPLPLHVLMSHECENCGYEFIILDRITNEVHWACMGQVDFCPRCGAVRGSKAAQPTLAGGRATPSAKSKSRRNTPAAKA